MAERAALLLDGVITEQHVRKWVLGMPYPLRFLSANRSIGLSEVTERSCTKCFAGLPLIGHGARGYMPLWFLAHGDHEFEVAIRARGQAAQRLWRPAPRA